MCTKKNMFFFNYICWIYKEIFNYLLLFFQNIIPKRGRRSEILQSYEQYQKEESEKVSTPNKSLENSSFSSQDLNTPLLQRIAKKHFNESQGASPALKKSAPKMKSARRS